jgi:hypothetical protein
MVTDRTRSMIGFGKFRTCEVAETTVREFVGGVAGRRIGAQV